MSVELCGNVGVHRVKRGNVRARTVRLPIALSTLEPAKLGRVSRGIVRAAAVRPPTAVAMSSACQNDGALFEAPCEGGQCRPLARLYAAVMTRAFLPQARV